MLLTPFAADATDDLTKKFVKEYKDKYDEVPNQFAADAYDGVKILAKLIESQKITGDMSASDICEKLKAGITAADFSYDGLTGTGLKWNANGEVSKSPKAVVIKDGNYAALDN